MRNLMVIIAVFLCIQMNAQKGVNKLVLAAEIGVPTGDFDKVATVGGGPIVKALFGVTPAGDITATSGVLFFPLKKEDLGFPDGFKGNWSLIPILVGYRHNFNGLFLEPQLGMAVYALTAKYQGNSESDSQSGFTWAAGAGYAKNNLEVGFRYQSTEKDGSLSVFAIHIGYIMPLKSRR